MKGFFALTILLGLTFGACKNKGCTDATALNYNSEAKKDDGSCEYANDTTPVDMPIGSTTNVMGYSILAKLPGIWNGPVTSSTALGGYPEWIVDFRPISGAQISAKNELDSVNDIFMSFFIAKFGNEYKMVMRNGGGFAGSVRTSYMVIDSVVENATFDFYRFSDPAGGETRVHTEITFKDDSLIMHTFTNDYNTLSTPVSHMKWTADLRDLTSAQSAVTQFSYPQKQQVIDFTTAFDAQTDAVYYGNTGDPYPESSQPYLGNTQVNVTITNPASVNGSKKVLIILTTEKLFNGFNFLPQNLDYRSRYVFVNAQTNCGFDFNYMHPGSYYINAIYDENGDYTFTSGDYMNASFDVPVTLSSEGSAVSNVTINFLIP
jgi:hypothetical protein